jgi:hypothetical protein
MLSTFSRGFLRERDLDRRNLDPRNMDPRDLGRRDSDLRNRTSRNRCRRNMNRRNKDRRKIRNSFLKINLLESPYIFIRNALVERGLAGLNQDRGNILDTWSICSRGEGRESRTGKI